MAQFWVVKPGEEGKLPGLEAEAARLQRELAEIEALSGAMACRLCGVQGALTEEHTPSKKSGNIGRMIRGVIDYTASVARGSVLWRGEPIQGVKREALCAPCNNRTGSWYNPAYVRFVNDCRAAARPHKAGRVCEIRTTAYRHRVATQALTSMVSTCQPGLTARYPDLRALLVAKEDSQAIPPLRLRHYLRANPGGVSTGITIAMNMERQIGHLVAGFSFWPLGWILTIGDVTVEGAVNVSAGPVLATMTRHPRRWRSPANGRSVCIQPTSEDRKTFPTRRGPRSPSVEAARPVERSDAGVSRGVYFVRGRAR